MSENNSADRTRGYEPFLPEGDWIVEPVRDPLRRRTLYVIDNGRTREHGFLEQNAVQSFIEGLTNQHETLCFVRGWLLDPGDCPRETVLEFVTAAIRYSRGTLPPQEELPPELPLLPASTARSLTLAAERQPAAGPRGRR